MTPNVLHGECEGTLLSDLNATIVYFPNEIRLHLDYSADNATLLTSTSKF